ncbi:angiomotin-like [Paramacrobiotus metropolitanus]|uniref:angiomotin-like n=1 Tax=Paramacrobiotus metropolitanus TaxID=2943436 RepID=UPI0024457A6F|nr:angiomotin-like [Paramacrobiotus metropolitanus]
MNARLHSASLDALKPSVSDDAHKMGSTSYEELQQRDLEDSDILKYLTRDIKRNSTEQLLHCAAMPSRMMSQVRPVVHGHYQKNAKLARQPVAEGSRSHTPSPKGTETGSVESVLTENAVLRKDIEGLVAKLSKMQKVEMEVDNIQQLYSHLQKSTQKREALENAIRSQLEKEKQLLLQENQQLREHVDALSRQISQRSPVVSEVDYQAAVKEFQLAVSRLTAQNKELIEGRKRQDIELAAQRATLDEQRNHIGILDSYLNSAQANIAALEEELSKRTQSNDRLQEVQQALASVQLASSKREATEKRLRAQMELEISNLKQEIRHLSGSGNSDSSGNKAEAAVDPTRTSLEGTEIPADTGKLQESIARLEQQLAEKNALINRYFRNLPASAPRPTVSHVRVLSEATKDSVSGNSASTADLHASSSQLSVQRPKSVASMRIEPKSQLWEV